MTTATPLLLDHAAPMAQAPAASPARAGDATTVLRHGDHPSAWLALNAGTARFRTPGLDGLVAYRDLGGWRFSIGNVMAAEADKPTLLRAFLDDARRSRRQVCAIQVRREEADLYAEAGFRLNQLGSSYSLGLKGFKLGGTRFMKLRNKLKRSRGLGVTVSEIGLDEPRTSAVQGELERVTAAWLRAMGRHTKLLEFMVGELGGVADPHRRVFVARQEGAAVGFITYVPAPGRKPGWMHDLTRRVPEAPPGAMELINATAIERLRGEGAEWLHFGLTPFVGVGPETDALAGRSEVVSRLVALLARYGSSVYPAQTQVAYKLKWCPDAIEPEFIAYQGRFKLGCLMRLLQVTRSI